MDRYDREDLQLLVNRYGIRRVLEALSWCVPEKQEDTEEQAR